jgi:hypothetical protein
MKYTPTVEERSKIEKSGGIVGDLYFDTDNNSATGRTYILLWDSDKYKWYEVRVWIPLGVETKSSGEMTSDVGYEIYMAEGDSFSGLETFSQNTTRKCSRIAHGPDGIEMALPLKKLGIQVPASIRVLLAEHCSNSKQEGYDVANLDTF